MGSQGRGPLLEKIFRGAADLRQRARARHVLMCARDRVDGHGSRHVGVPVGSRRRGWCAVLGRREQGDVPVEGAAFETARQSAVAAVDGGAPPDQPGRCRRGAESPRPPLWWVRPRRVVRRCHSRRAPGGPGGRGSPPVRPPRAPGRRAVPGRGGPPGRPPRPVRGGGQRRRGHQATGRPADQVVGTGRPDLADLLDVVVGHLGEALRHRLLFAEQRETAAPAAQRQQDVIERFVPAPSLGETFLDLTDRDTPEPVTRGNAP